MAMQYADFYLVNLFGIYVSRIEFKARLILDHLNCSPSTLKLVPVWLPDAAEATVFSTSPVYFDFMAQTDMPSLDFRLVFTFNDTIREIPMSLPNPMKEKSNPVFNTQTSELTWQTVASQLKPAVEEYKVTVITTSVVCGTTETHEIAVRSRDDCPSVLKTVYESETPREHIVSLEPSQSVSCDMKVNRSASEPDATFDIKSFGILSNGKSQIPIEGVSFTKVEDTDPQTPGGMYRVENLLPGREYELRGAVKYPSGMEDEMSKEILFVTPDEILVDVDEAIKELGEEFQVTCKAYVGTQKNTQKEVLWLRSDRSRLPEGATSRTNRTPNADGFCTATLMIPRVETWHAGDYGCFVEPPVEFFLHVPARSVLFTLRVGSLTLDKKQYKAKRGETVEVICSTTQFGPLTWKLADGRHAPVYPSASSAPTAEPVFATPESPPVGRSQALRLWIKEATESTEGEYVCSMKNESNNAEITQRFQLQLNSSVGIVKINTAPVTFGEQHVFTCRAEAPDGVPLIRWYWYRPEDAVFEAIEGTRNGASASADVNISGISTLRIRALPGLQGTLICALIPPDWEFSEESEIPYYAMSESILVRAETEVAYAASVEIRKPYKLDLGDSIAVDCFGYPSVANDKLQWIFEGVNETITSFVIQPDVSDASSVKGLRSCFSIGRNSPAEWPEHQTDDKDAYKPDHLRIHVSTDRSCLEAEGRLTCRYSGEGDGHSAIKSKLQSEISKERAVAAVLLEEIRDVHKQNSTPSKGQPEDWKQSQEEKGSTISLEVSPSTANRPEDTEREIRGSAGEFVKQRTSDSVRIYPYISFSLLLTVALRRSLVQDYFVLV
ncbi:Sialoadhesin [Sparganum proliferum]